MAPPKKKRTWQTQWQIIYTMYVPENMTVEDEEEWVKRRWWWWWRRREDKHSVGEGFSGESLVDYIYTSLGIPISAWIFYLQCSDGYQLAEEMLLPYVHLRVKCRHSAMQHLSTSECLRCSSWKTAQWYKCICICMFHTKTSMNNFAKLKVWTWGELLT